MRVDWMTPVRFVGATTILLAASLAAPVLGNAQNFKVDKYDIKGDGGTDYVAVEAATGRVFVSRATNMMVVDGRTGNVVGDIMDTPGVHGAGIATKAGHGFTTNGGNSTVTMFDLKTLAVIKQIPIMQGGLDGIMYDEPDDKIILTNHSRPVGLLIALDPKSGDVVGTAELEDNAPEGAAADGKGHIFVNNERKNTIQVIDVKTWKATASWPVAPCQGPTGIAYDKASDRIFAGCNNTSVVVDPSTGKVVASIKNGTRVDALGWDPGKRLIYIPNGGQGNVTVVHQDSADKYTIVATVDTFVGAKTICADPKTHNVYLFQPERVRLSSLPQALRHRKKDEAAVALKGRLWRRGSSRSSSSARPRRLCAIGPEPNGSPSPTVAEVRAI